MSSKLTPQDSAEEQFEDELKPGTELLHGQYEIEQFLNNGGFGITYLAKDSLLRRVVIKECFPESICRRANSTVRVRSRDQADAFRAIVDLFIEEARGLARLSHPNIVGVHQVFEDNDTAYMAMDFVAGRDLLEIAETEEVIEPKVFEVIVYKLLDAVAFIHTEGVLHRDISPDNILLSQDNEPVLIDFGAARETVTRATSYLGSMRTVKDGYSPQEFYVKDSEQHPSSDLYSLAASIYHVITKELPVNAQKRMTAIANGDPDPYVPIKSLVSDYSEPFLDAIDHALRVFPKDRIQSAGEWQAMIADAIPSVSAQGTVSRPMLAVDNGSVVEQYEQKEKKSFLSGRKASAKQVSVRAERPASELEPGQRDVVSSQAQVARAMTPNSGTAGNGRYVGMAAVAVIAVLGAGAVLFSGGSDDDQVVAQGGQETGNVPAPVVADAGAATPSQAAQRDSNKPEQVPFFLADSSAGDVEVSSAAGSRLTAADTGPIASAQVPRDQGVNQTPGAATASDLAGAQAATPSTTVVSAPATVQSAGAGSFVTAAALSFPVNADPADGAIIASLGGLDSSNIEEGQRLISVNGFPIQAIEDFQRVAAATVAFSVGDTVEVSLGIENPSTGATFVEKLTLPAVQQTTLSNGVVFETRRDGDSWVTFVTRGAGLTQSELQTGDQLVAFMPSNELIDTQDGLSTILTREADNGAAQINFAIRRDNDMWLVAMPYTAGQ
ncbi:MAG: protein kinase [Pseudomonadota bacterium]